MIINITNIYNNPDKQNEQFWQFDQVYNYFNILFY